MAIGALTIPASGMHAAVSAFDASATNIANSSTPGYKRIVPEFQHEETGGVIVQFKRDETPGVPEYDLYTNTRTESSNTNLINEMTAQIADLALFKANVQVLKAEDYLLGEVVNILA
jgi:flagellar basal body rod protein FlgG